MYSHTCCHLHGLIDVTDPTDDLGVNYTGFSFILVSAVGTMWNMLSSHPFLQWQPGLINCNRGLENMDSDPNLGLNTCISWERPSTVNFIVDCGYICLALWQIFCQILIFFTCLLQLHIMKGKFQRRRSGFTKGHQKYHRPTAYPVLEEEGKVTKRLTVREFASVIEEDSAGVLGSRDAEGKRVNTRVLRPTSNEPDFWDVYNQEVCAGNQETYILVHRRKVGEMWNSAFRAHTASSPSCQGNLSWDEDRCEKRGVCWIMSVSCMACGFKHSRDKLYEEVATNSRGRKCAAPNVGLQVGLARQGISSAGFTEVWSSLNAVPPSLSGLQKAANNINPKIIAANRADMNKRVSDLKALNEKRGLSYGSAINIEADGTYNNRLSSGVGKTPMQPATQTTYLVAENVTSNREIIYAGTYSKLCSCKRNAEGNIIHKSHCTANLAEDAVIGNEGRYLEESVRHLNSEGLSVQHVTLDGDSNANSAVDNIMQSCDPKRKIKVSRCTRHLSKSMQRDLGHTKFSDRMFPGRTKKDREQAQARFTIDVGARCHAEYNAIHKKHGGNINDIKNKCSFVVSAIQNCYQGDCDECAKYSFVCDGSKKKWPRPYLSSSPAYRPLQSFINPNKGDQEKLKRCIDMRLGQEAVGKTALNANTNKCEGANRGLSKGVPKHNTFSRNYHGRVHACVHSMNNGPGASLCQLCSAVGAKLTPKSGVTKSLRQLDATRYKDKLRKKGRTYNQRRVMYRNRRYQKYDEKKAAACYSKGQADKGSISQRTKGTAEKDGVYSTRLRRQRLRTSTLVLDHNYLVRGSVTNEHSYA